MAANVKIQDFIAPSMDKVNKLLKSHPNLCIIKEKEDGKCKIVCQLTSHEMPCTLKAVQMYINGKKYKYECEHKLTSKETELCSQYLVEKRRGQLFCTLTKRYINNLPHHIRQHLNGQRFQKAIKNTNSTGTKSSPDEPKQHKKTESDKVKETEMWIPSDSESESAEIEELGSEFAEKKTVESKTEDNYSFDALDMEVEEEIEENDKETSSKKEKSKTKLKRSAKNLEKSTKKGKKPHINEMPKKKRKKTL